MKPFTIHPRDLLFFRDARPMGGSSEGAGAGWPLPSVLHAAVLSACHDRWQQGTEWESKHTHLTEKETRKRARGQQWNPTFGGLRTVGPFPCLQTTRTSANGNTPLPPGVYLPTPADVVPGGIMQPIRSLGDSNLPKPLSRAVASSVPPTKERLGTWMHLAALQMYLQGDLTPVTTPAADLYDAESRPGVGIAPATHANAQSVFYQAEYLRLRPDVCMLFLAEGEARKVGQNTGVDVLEQLTTDGACPLILGGQRGLATLQPQPATGTLDVALPACGTRVKWVLLTPALFDNGWRPDWVSASGDVLLQDMPARAGYATRKAWRLAASQRKAPLAARLVAARIPRAEAVSGWKLDGEQGHSGGTPKPTRLLVPAGSVYYFECADDAAAATLVRQLHLKVKSQRLGEKGFGFGVCGSWQYLDV
ncbi:hypothetical protein HQ520_17540 [bacterium]|nr:hypothetical protein [bacterium]